MVSNMKKNINTKIIPLLLLIVLTSFTSVVFASWVVTSSSIFKPEEVPIIKDPELLNYSLQNTFEYYREEAYPHKYLGKQLKDFEEKYDVTYYSKDKNNNLTKIDIEKTSQGGKYVARYFNKESRIYSDYEYVVNPREPYFAIKGYSPERAYYNPSLGPSESDFEYSGFGESIKGTITYAKSFPAEGVSNIDDLYMKVVCTFTPSSQYSKNYTAAKVEVSIPLYAVAKIGTTYYSRIETALEKAVSGNEIKIVFTNNVSCNPIIYEDCTIKSGVTLHINFAEGSANSSKGVLSGLSSIPATSTATNKVTVKDNVTLNIEENGKLEIGGQLSGGGADKPCGNTAGSFSNVILEKNASICSYGIIDCYGYITEATENNGSKVESFKGHVYMPFIIRDFRGGSITSGMYNAECPPFNQYETRNIQPLLIVHYDSNLSGYANLYANSQQNNTTIALISNTSKSLIQLNNSRYSYLEGKYDVSSECSTINIYGGAQTNAMSMEVMGLTVNTSNAYFPISFRQEINLLPNTTNGQNIANFVINQKYKIMPGGVLTIHKGASLEANTFEVYKVEDYTVTVTVGSSPYPYLNKDAQLIVNGKLTIEYLGGVALSEEIGAILNIRKDNTNGLPILEPISSSGKLFATVKYTTNVVYDRVNLKSENNEQIESDASAGIYESKLYSSDSSNYYYWEKYDSSKVKEFTIIYNTNSDDSELNPVTIYSLENTLTLTESLLPDENTVVKKGHDFLGWYLDSGLTKPAINETIASENIPDTATEITLYANWDIATYSISYQFILGEEYADLSELVQGSDFPKEYTINSEFNSLPDLIYSGYDFLGWYYLSGDTFIQIDNFSVNYADDVMFIARFQKEQNPYQIQYQLVKPDGSFAESGILVESIKELSSFNINNVEFDSFIKSYCNNDNSSIIYYFEGYNLNNSTGWYVDSKLKSGLSTLTNDDVDLNTDNFQIIILYGCLLEKVIITYNGDTSNKFYYIPNSTIEESKTVTYNENMKQFWSTNGVDLLGECGSPIKIPEVDTDMKLVKFIKVSVSTTDSTVTLTPETTEITTMLNSSNTPIFIIETSGTYYIKLTTKVNYSFSHSKSDNLSFKITSGNKTVVENKSSEGDGSFNIEFESAYSVNSSSSSCITGDTLITLADGTKKMVKDLTATDLLLVFNHETGKYEAMPIIFNDVEPEGIYRIVNLKFSDGTIVKVVYEHGFFDLDENKYVYIREDNMKEFIGHKFYKAEYDGINYIESEVTLIDAYVTEELTTVYSPVTVYHLNYFTEDMLSMPAGIPGLFNIFEFGDNLTYDQEQMQKDIETYGLYTYDDFDEYISYEVYSMFPAPYLKVAVGKGLTTFEDIVDMIYLYLEKHELTK